MATFKSRHSRLGGNKKKTVGNCLWELVYSAEKIYKRVKKCGKISLLDHKGEKGNENKVNVRRYLL